MRPVGSQKNQYVAERTLLAQLAVVIDAAIPVIKLASMDSDQINHHHSSAGISSYFPGFPLDKAVDYAKLRNPLLINDLNMQYFIQDRFNTHTHAHTRICVQIFSVNPLFGVRREVYRILKEEGIDLPRYAVLNRDPHHPDGERSSQEV